MLCVWLLWYINIERLFTKGKLQVKKYLQEKCGSVLHSHSRKPREKKSLSVICLCLGGSGNECSNWDSPSQERQGFYSSYLFFFYLRGRNTSMPYLCFCKAAGVGLSQSQELGTRFLFSEVSVWLFWAVICFPLEWTLGWSWNRSGRVRTQARYSHVDVGVIAATRKAHPESRC